MAAADAMIDPQSDFDVAVDFLQRWMPGGPWVLTAINPRDRGIQTLAFIEPGRLRDLDDRTYRDKLRKDGIDV